MAELTRNGTPDNGKARVYGGDCNLVHIADGTRKEVGEEIAMFLDDVIRDRAELQGKDTEGKYLCPGCAMIALFNASIITARNNGQPLSELARTMAHAYDRLLANPEAGLTEEIEVILDGDDGDDIPLPALPTSGEDALAGVH